MACAISSLPVPVSPWIRTVESDGATRSICSSTASRAELLPITCSNLRSSRSWLREFNPWKAATENLLAIRMLATVRGSTLQRRAYILEQDFIVERFCHEFHCACSQSLHPHF